MVGILLRVRHVDVAIDCLQAERRVAGRDARIVERPAGPTDRGEVGVEDNNHGAIYKGLAVSAGGSGPLMYASDFHNNRIGRRHRRR